ncbi:hypothetical protein BDV96DRAFT_489653, partial [Lophiotrema nucula]
KSLRVSTSIGPQRSSYYVSMPLRYGIPLMAKMSLLHWTLSQGLFVVPLETPNNDGTVDTSSCISYLGFSLLPLFTAGNIVLVMVIAIVLGSLHHYPSGMPMGATYSAVVSAACHQPLPDDQDAYKFPV